MHGLIQPSTGFHQSQHVQDSCYFVIPIPLTTTRSCVVNVVQFDFTLMITLVISEDREKNLKFYQICFIVIVRPTSYDYLFIFFGQYTQTMIHHFEYWLSRPGFHRQISSDCSKNFSLVNSRFLIICKKILRKMTNILI